MRSLRITLYTQSPIQLPIAYSEWQQGLLYSCWHDSYPALHDNQANDGRAFRPFVFSKLEGRCKANGKEHTICFYDLISFEVRSPVEGILDTCAAQLAARPSIRLGSAELQLVNLESRDRMLFPQRATIRMRTPVLAYQTLQNGHKQYFSPLDSEWLPLIQQNAQRKAEEFGVGASTNLQIIALPQSLRKNVTAFKGTYLTGWTGNLIVSTEGQMLPMLWYCGLGVRNSQGFGLFDILDKPL